MVKSRIFDNTQLLKEHPELPHYKEEVVCFRILSACRLPPVCFRH